jgi:hypothetical protein
MYFAVFFLLLGSYMELTEYWIHAHWTRADARVLSVRVYESVARVGERGNSPRNGSRCEVSYAVAGAQRQSEIDSGVAFTSTADAGSCAARFPFGRRISILYKPSDPGVVRLDGEAPPTYVTAARILQLAVFFLLAGLLVKISLKEELRPSEI